MERERVLTIIAESAWCGISPDGAFNWQLSLEKLAENLRLPIDQVKETMEESFTPQCLTQVEIQTPEGLKRKPLIEVLHDEGIETFVWTVGDEYWQRTKFEKTGANNFIPLDHYIFSHQKKEKTLRKLIETIANQEQDCFVIVVDDKKSNVDYVAQLGDEFRERIEIGNYHMKLNDPQANPTAFYRWLQDQIKNHPGKKLKLILDFDGVIADTDSVLFGPVVDRLDTL